MSTTDTTKFHRGQKIILENEIWEIIEFQHRVMQARKPIVKTKLKNIISGLTQEKSFRSGDIFEQPDLVNKNAQFLYSNGDAYTFMDLESYEQIEVSKNVIGGKSDFLKEELNVQLLNYAKSLGDTLTVGIDSDRRVQEKKGPTRPVNSVGDRAYMLQNLKAVDYIVIFDSDEELERCIKTVKPDIMVVGSDWKDKSVIGSMYSAELRFFDRIEEYATTKTIQDIINRG